MVLLSREVSQVDSCQLPCPLSTPSKSPAVTLSPGTIPRSLWDVLEYLSPSQCRKQWEFSKDRTQQEARGAAHLQHVQLEGNKEGKVLGAVPGFPNRGKVLQEGAVG